MKALNWKKRIITPGFLTPKGFVLRAAILAVVFATCHFVGWREHTSFLSGTAASASDALHASAILGVIYIAVYFGFVLVAPILLLAAAILFGLERVTRAQKEKLTTPAPLAHGLVHKS
jgi:hypothetical protein